MLQNSIARFWRWLPKSLRRWLLRFSNSTFTVTVAALIFNDQGKILILKHRFRPGAGWGIPGGFLKANEQPLEALQRELQEEIGLRLDSPQIFEARSFRKWRQVEVLFRGHTQGDPRPASMEVEQVLWCSPEELPEGLPDNQKILIERAVAKHPV